MDPVQKLVFLQGGEVIRYDLLVSTIPLDLLLEMTLARSDKTSCSAKSLEKQAVRIMRFGVSGQPEADFHWAYYPQREIPFLRVSIPSFFAADVALGDII